MSLKDYKSVVAQRIKSARKAAGFKTQNALADALDIDQSRVARWEIGQNLPTGTYRSNLLKTLKKSDVEIFGHVDPSDTAPDILEAIERGVAKTLGPKDISPDKQKLFDAIARIDDGLARQILKMIEPILADEIKNRRRP